MLTQLSRYSKYARLMNAINQVTTSARQPFSSMEQADSTIRTKHGIQDYIQVTPGITQTNLESLVDQYDYFIFDCDGVLFHSGDEVGEAFNALRYIKKHAGKHIYFFTNALARTREVFLNDKIIGEHGFTEIPIENLYTVSYLTCLYVRDTLFPRMRKERPHLFEDEEPAVYVIGEQSFRDELKSFGIRVINPELQGYPPTYGKFGFNDMAKAEADPTVVGVLVGTDYHLNFRNLCEASMYLSQNQAEFVALNMDRSDGKERLRPSGGSLIKVIQSVSQTDLSDIQVIGKPNRWGFDLIRQQHNLEDVPLEKFLMVGDNLATDIQFGNSCGIDSCLVLSGVTNVTRAEYIINEAQSGQRE